MWGLKFGRSKVLFIDTWDHSGQSPKILKKDKLYTKMKWFGYKFQLNLEPFFSRKLRDFLTGALETIIC